jgi:hypothetical protein
MDCPEGLVEIVTHLARAATDLLTSAPSGLEAPLLEVTDRIGAQVGRTLFHLANEAARAMNPLNERRATDVSWWHFSKLPKEVRREAVEANDLFHTWTFAERLWRESVNAAADDAKRALELGQMAVLAAERFNGEKAFRSRLLGLAWSAVANASGRKPALVAEEDLVEPKGFGRMGRPASRRS